MNYGPRMSPTPAGDNVLLTYENKIYTLSISGASYLWLEKPQQLSISRKNHVQLTLPASLISACTLVGRVFTLVVRLYRTGNFLQNILGCYSAILKQMIPHLKALLYSL